MKTGGADRGAYGGAPRRESERSRKAMKTFASPLYSISSTLESGERKKPKGNEDSIILNLYNFPNGLSGERKKPKGNEDGNSKCCAVTPSVSSGERKKPKGNEDGALLAGALLAGALSGERKKPKGNEDITLK